MLNLYEKYISLNQPPDNTNNIQAIRFNKNMDHRVGKDSENHAVALFKIDNPNVTDENLFINVIVKYIFSL